MDEAQAFANEFGISPNTIFIPEYMSASVTIEYCDRLLIPKPKLCIHGAKINDMTVCVYGGDKLTVGLVHNLKIDLAPVKRQEPVLLKGDGLKTIDI